MYSTSMMIPSIAEFCSVGEPDLESGQTRVIQVN